jgi:hypothetical protein
MILHASVAADEPKGAAETLAALLGGRALPVGPGEGTWTAFGPDPIGNVIEVLARGSEFHRLPGESVETRRGEPVRHSAFHLLIDTGLSEGDVLNLADARGCHAQRMTHGPFEVIEFWLDDCLLIEVATPELGSEYRRLFNSGELRRRYADRLA